MSIQQCASAAVQVFPSTPIHTRSGVYSLPVVMVAIAGTQSAWNPRAAGDCGLSGPSCGSCTLGGAGATSWGFWQIHNSTSTYLIQRTHSTKACDWAAWLFDPVHNAEAAYYLYRLQGLSRAWGGASGVWDTQAVQANLPQSAAAVKAAQAARTRHTTTTATAPPQHVPKLLWIPGVIVGIGLAVVLTDVGVEEHHHHERRMDRGKDVMMKHKGGRSLWNRI